MSRRAKDALRVLRGDPSADVGWETSQDATRDVHEPCVILGRAWIPAEKEVAADHEALGHLLEQVGPVGVEPSLLVDDRRAEGAFKWACVSISRPE
jgi:hypothetical protein